MVYIAQQSFGFGEVDPNIRAQYESQPYQSGCQTLTNAILSSTGSAAKRWGSVDDTSYQTATEKSYQYVTGYGERIMIYGGTTTYTISSFNHPVQTFTGMILDVAYRGPDLIVLTDKGVFRHEFGKFGTNYSSLRYAIELPGILINSTPPVTMAFSAKYDAFARDTVLTAGSGWFDSNDGGDMYVLPYRYNQTLAGGGTGLAPGRSNWGYTLVLNSAGYISSTQFNCKWDYHNGPLGNTEAQNIETLDWSGPYRNWIPVGKILTNRPTPGAPLAGVIYSANWAVINDGPGPFPLQGLNLALWQFSTDIDSDTESVLEPGKIGKIVITYNMGSGPVVRYEQHFLIGDKQVYDLLTRTRMLRKGIDEQNLAAPTGWNSSDGKTLQIFLASSDGLYADGLPTPKNGFFPSVVARTKSQKTNPSATYEPVQLVGSQNNTTIDTTYPVFSSSGGLLSTTVASTTCRQNAPIGEVYPLIGSDTFRISEWEIEDWSGKVASGDSINAPFDSVSTLWGDPGWGAYWKITGRALRHFGDTPAGHTQDLKPLTVNTIEIHQERTFLAGFDGSKSTLAILPEIQNLGLTIISSKSGELTNFNTGSLDADGLSFIISSKAGGKISWLKSQFNQLFVGTTQEEYVITSVPISSGTLNVELQSSYGSEFLKEAILFGSDIVFIPTGKRTIRAISYADRRQRYETEDLFQFAKHLTKNETIERVELVSTEFQRLFVRTSLGNLYCFSKDVANGVYGWSQWNNSNYTTIDDIVGTVDDSGNASLWARVLLTGATTVSRGSYITSDPTYYNRRMDLIEEHTGGDIVNTGALAGVINISADLLGKEVSYILEVGGVELYYGNATVQAGNKIFFGDSGTGTVLGTTPTKVYIGLPYTFSLVPNIPEFMLPGKGSTSGRNKNISRIRAYLNAARGGVVEGYSILPATAGLSLVPDSPGFYSVSVIGEYGPQPKISINQSVPYEFELSGYNAEYDFGD